MPTVYISEKQIKALDSIMDSFNCAVDQMEFSESYREEAKLISKFIEKCKEAIVDEEIRRTHKKLSDKSRKRLKRFKKRSRQ